MPVKKGKSNRTFEQLKESYDLEKELSNKLRYSTKEERKHLNLYTSLYDEFYKKAPNHPVLILKDNPKGTAKVVAKWMKVLNYFLSPDATFLEIGPGDCSLSFELAKRVRKIYAVDVSNEVTKRSTLPPNFELLISDGCSIPVPENSINIAYSHQLMEHLHPDDAIEQLQNVYRALVPGGIYICITPNRLSGPHDTSQYFDEVAQGWHLKEYTVTELYELFRTVGFSKISYYKSHKKIHIEFPLTPVIVPLLKASESLLSLLPAPFRSKSAMMLSFRGITIVGTKQS